MLVSLWHGFIVTREGRGREGERERGRERGGREREGRKEGKNENLPCTGSLPNACPATPRAGQAGTTSPELHEGLSGPKYLSQHLLPSRRKLKLEAHQDSNPDTDRE